MRLDLGPEEFLAVYDALAERIQTPFAGVDIIQVYEKMRREIISRLTTGMMIRPSRDQFESWAKREQAKIDGLRQKQAANTDEECFDVPSVRCD